MEISKKSDILFLVDNLRSGSDSSRISSSSSTNEAFEKQELRQMKRQRLPLTATCCGFSSTERGRSNSFGGKNALMGMGLQMVVSTWHLGKVFSFHFSSSLDSFISFSMKKVLLWLKYQIGVDFLTGQWYWIKIHLMFTMTFTNLEWLFKSVFLSPLYRWKKKFLENLSDVPRVSWLTSKRFRIGTIVLLGSDTLIIQC